jgi:hypothetical protein
MIIEVITHEPYKAIVSSKKRIPSTIIATVRISVPNRYIFSAYIYNKPETGELCCLEKHVRKLI